MDPQTKELHVLLRHVPRIVVSRFVRRPQHLQGPEAVDFAAAVALFDLSGFSSLGSKLSEDERDKIKAEGSMRHERHRASLPSVPNGGRNDRTSSGGGSLGEEVEKIEPTNIMRERRRTASVSSPQTAGGSKTLSFLSLTKPAVAPQGSAVETLTTTLNKSLEPVIDVIIKHGGDIIKFAGDALIVLWETEITEGKQTPVGELSLRAIRCAIEAQHVLNAVSAGQENLSTLGMHIGIGASQVTGNHVGGILNRWEFYLSGDANRQMSFAEQHAKRGEVMISPEVKNELDACFQDFEQTEVHMELSSGGNYKVHSSQPDWTRSRSSHNTQSTSPRIDASQDLIPFLRAYVPGTIASYLQKGLTLTSCTLHITVVFARLEGVVDIKDPRAQLQQIHKYMCVIQESAYKVQGTLRQFVIDDKGAVAIIAIGLPPFYHEDNAFRGIKFACYLLEKGVPASIGITTGNAFCGSVGSKARAEYAVVGDMINLAARLMTAAGVGKILCDENTRDNSESFVQYDSATEISVKGKSESVRVFSVQRDQIKTKLDAAYLKDTVHALPYGCDRIVEQVPLFGSRWIRQERSDAMHRVLVVSGESGTGKTMLLRYFLHHNSRCYMGSGDPLESSLEFHAWRGIVRELMLMTIRPPTSDGALLSGGGGSGHSDDVLGDDDNYSRMSIDDTESEGQTPPTGSTAASRRTRTSDVSTLETFHEDLDSPMPAQPYDLSGIAPTSPQYYHGSVVGTGRTSVLKYLLLTHRISRAMLSVLNDLLPHARAGGLDESILLERGEERSKILEEVLFLIVEAVSTYKPILLTFDNAQWIDPMSWTLIRRIVEDLPGVYFLIATRAGQMSYHHTAFELIERNTAVKKMEVRFFSYQITSLFLCQYYHIAIMDTQLLDFVYTRTDGNPAALIKLMNAMMEANYIQVDPQTGNIAILHDLDDLDTQVPQHTRVRVMSCIDLLDDLAHMTLKIMSVNPDPIEQKVLNGILSRFINTDRKDSTSEIPGIALKAPKSESSISPLLQVRVGLAGCEKNGIITIDDHNKVLFFNSTEMRLVVYDTMLPSQRKMLHGLYADHLREVITGTHRRMSAQLRRTPSASNVQDLIGSRQNDSIGNSSPSNSSIHLQYAVLGYHLSRSGDDRAAIDAYHKAGEGAIELKEFSFATDCIQSSYKILDAAHRTRKLPELDYILLRSRIEFMRGAVAVEKSEWDLAITHLSYIVRLCQRKGSLLRRYSSSIRTDGSLLMFESMFSGSSNALSIAHTSMFVRDHSQAALEMHSLSGPHVPLQPSGCLPFIGGGKPSWFTNLRNKGLMLHMGLFMNGVKRKKHRSVAATGSPRSLTQVVAGGAAPPARVNAAPRMSRIGSGRVQPEEALEILNEVNFYRKRASMLIKKISRSKKKQEEMSRDIQILTLKSLHHKDRRR